jgi:hypothetical protein
MTQYKRIAIDTSEAVFTLHGINATCFRYDNPNSCEAARWDRAAPLGV